jgi:aminoglycoside phosphotransferase (APT) family kinase protein
LRQLGHLLRELHSTAAPNAFCNQAPWIDRKLGEAQVNLKWSDGTRELLHELQDQKPSPTNEALIHGDLALDNVLVAVDGSMGLIDWSGGDLGDPRYDISLAVATEPEICLSKAEIAEFFDGYGGAHLDAATIESFRNLYEFF